MVTGVKLNLTVSCVATGNPGVVWECGRCGALLLAATYFDGTASVESFSCVCARVGPFDMLPRGWQPIKLSSLWL